jgi:hypothetical protein
VHFKEWFEKKIRKIQMPKGASHHNNTIPEAITKFQSLSAKEETKEVLAGGKLEYAAKATTRSSSTTRLRF